METPFYTMPYNLFEDIWHSVKGRFQMNDGRSSSPKVLIAVNLHCACMLYRRLLTALHYSDFILGMIISNPPQFHCRRGGLLDQMPRSVIAAVEDYWIWHI